MLMPHEEASNSLKQCEFPSSEIYVMGINNMALQTQLKYHSFMCEEFEHPHMARLSHAEFY